MNISPMHKDALTFAAPATATKAHSVVPGGLAVRVPIESAFINTLVIAIAPISLYNGKRGREETHGS